MTLYEILCKNTKEHSENTAFSYFDKKYTYKTLLCMADEFASKLQSDGITKESTVAVCLPNCPALLAALYGSNKLGARVVFLNPKSPASELLTQISMTAATVLVYSTVSGNTIKEMMEQRIKQKAMKLYYVSILRDLPVKFQMFCMKKLYPFNSVSKIRKITGTDSCRDFFDKSGNNSRPTVNSDDTLDAVVIFSGGTSGEMKAVVHSSVAVNNACRSCGEIVKEYNKRLRVLAVLPSFHIFGLIVAIAFPVYSGGECVLMPFFHIDTIVKLMAGKCPDVIPGVPAIFKKICENKKLSDYEKRKKLDLSNLLWAISGGDYLSDEIYTKFSNMIKNNGGSGYISAGYGMTECCPIAVSSREDNEAGCVGPEFFGCTVTVHDKDTGRILPDGEEGELYLSSDYLMSYYFYEDGKRIYPESLNGTKYIKTGDIGSIKNGKIFYKHRLRRIIKVSGNSVFAGSVERVLERAEGIERAIVVPVKHAKRINETFAFVVPNKDIDVTVDKLMNVCRKQLVPYAIPAGIVLCKEEDIPYTPLGKIAYGVLEKKANEYMYK